MIKFVHNNQTRVFVNVEKSKSARNAAVNYFQNSIKRDRDVYAAVKKPRSVVRNFNRLSADDVLPDVSLIVNFLW